MPRHHAGLTSSQIHAVLGFSYYKLVSFFTPRELESSPLNTLESLSLGLKTMKKTSERKVTPHVGLFSQTIANNTSNGHDAIYRKMDRPVIYYAQFKDDRNLTLAIDLVRQPHACFKSLLRVLLSYRMVSVVW